MFDLRYLTYGPYARGNLDTHRTGRPLRATLPVTRRGRGEIGLPTIVIRRRHVGRWITGPTNIAPPQHDLARNSANVHVWTNSLNPWSPTASRYSVRTFCRGSEI